MDVPTLSYAVPKRGNAFSRWLGRSILSAMGWRIEGRVPNLPRLVVIAVPHTSAWDFLVGMAGMFALGIRISWLGKHTLFRPPLGGLMRWLGGIAVDRRTSGGLVDKTAALFNRRDKLILGLAPEGTRKKVDTWRSGFYHIAYRAGVPIVPVALDYGTRTLRIGSPLVPSGDYEADLPRLRAFFEGVVGKRPEYT